MSETGENISYVLYRYLALNGTPINFELNSKKCQGWAMAGWAVQASVLIWLKHTKKKKKKKKKKEKEKGFFRLSHSQIV